MIFRLRLALLPALLFFSSLASAQTLTCFASAAAAPVLRSTGVAEQTGDVIVTCSGGTPTPVSQNVPGANFTITAPVGITSRLLANGWSEALLLIDEPPAAGQLACATGNGVCIIAGSNNNGTYNGTQGHPNIFQAQQSNPTQLQFLNVPFDPPGAGKARILRFTNIRVNATSVPATSAIPLIVSTTAGIPISTSSPQVGITATPVSVTAKGVQTGVNGLAQFFVSFGESTPSAFKTRTIAVDPNTSPQPLNQNSPGQSSTLGTETDFYNGALPNIDGRGNLGRAGLADNGTRLLVVFTGVQQGVGLRTNTSVALTPGTGMLRLITTDSTGTGAFSASGVATLFPDSTGTIVAAYEVLTTDPTLIETADLPFFVVYGNGAPRTNVLSASAGIAPQNTTGTPDLTAPLPRFGALTPLQVSSLSIGPSSIPQGAIGGQYSVQFTATGGSGPYTWASVGSLPPGLSLDRASGVLTGVPTTQGSYQFAIVVTDSTQSTASASYALTIGNGFVITTASLPNGTVGVPYSSQIQYVGAVLPVSFSIPGGLLIPQSVPPGLTLSKSGLFAGTPLTAGSYTFTVEADDAANHQQTPRYTVNISPALVITTVSPLPTFPAGAGQSTFQFVAQGGTPPYVFTIDGKAPPGLSITPTGLLNGVATSAGTFAFTLRVTDAQQISITKQFQLTVSPAPTLLQVSSNQLNFTSLLGGDPPAPQTLVVTSSSLTPVSFTATLDSGTDGSPAPRWLTVKPTQGVTPAGLLVIVDQSSLVVGIADARIHLTIPNDATRVPIDIGVHLDINAGSAQLEAAPAFIRLRAHVSSPQIFKQTILLRDSGGAGPISYAANVVGKSSWITGLSVTGGQTFPGRGTPLIVTVNTAGLKTGFYHDVIHFVWSIGSLDVPITVFVADAGPILGVDTRGVRFLERQGAGSSYTQTVKILDLGDTGSSVTWSADLVSGSEWLALNATRGTATPNAPGAIVLSVTGNAVNLATGPHYALIRIVDLFSQTSPQFVVAVLDVQPTSAAPQPELSTGALYFSTPLGSTSAVGGTVRVFTSSTNAVNFQASASTTDGAAWLQVNPTSASISTSTPGNLSVVINPTGLAGGIYKGQINVAMNGILRTKDVSLVVVGNSLAAPAGESARAGERDAGCAPTKLVLTLGNLSSSFETPAQYPAVISAQLNDNCNNPIAGASVVASFSNGDAPIALANDGISNSYTETWQPGFAQANMAVTVRANFDPYQEASAQMTGTVDASAAPVLNRGGTANNLNPRLDAPIAPGTVTAIFGSHLASQTLSPGVLPLLTNVNGTFVLVGGTQLPLYYVSDGQINAEIPTDLPVNRQAVVLVGSNGGYTLPDTISITPVDPGVAAFPNGLLIAQHADFTLVDDAHPARPGETLIMYLVGMGATSPAVGTGLQAPSALASVATAATVTVGGQPAQISFAGLTPGGIGLYQINFVVPPGTAAANVDVVVKQGDSGVSNTTQLIVR